MVLAQVLAESWQSLGKKSRVRTCFGTPEHSQILSNSRDNSQIDLRTRNILSA
jgi:hypothetical protein